MRAKLQFGILAGLLLPALLAAPSLAASVDEYQVKAAFVVNFASFVEWPREAFPSAAAPVNLCILGRNPFGHTLEAIAEGKTALGRPLAVRELSDVRQIAGCHIVFVSSSERLRFRLILDSLRDSTIFTVGDASDFLAQGGVANLWLDQGKVRVEISPDAARAHNLRISSRLMSLSKAAN